MTTYLVPLVLIGGLTGTGVYLLLERNLTRMLLGLLLIGNAVNLLILVMGGDSGNPPVRDRTSHGQTGTADPLAQGMVLTSIVITMGVAAFVLALNYRAYRLTTVEEVGDDPEDSRLVQLSSTDTPSVDEDRAAPSVTTDANAPAELDALPADAAEQA
ncbi:Na(+)/H(+) antiporter subunit C [Mycobacterium sp. CBMA293]|uniref:Na(+)/H(+) antiporter subunit C n=1 Tax=unclassified Mycolicibacterium TaxID=2636767 RepID=UPI0012DF6863|nr:MULTISPECIES: Na(+)/H(+) antiporter subunit C [unclassified Mycolicibacterium]MUL44521.1 Na(+)/H(+) antiporter subunit C [Mycolicibacterium sp. CBMA 360]MUL59841.1 Na(+)/H(+) antiporter subunit C [Mycolicibacterium sp. CBMA 335]MUL66436.1 Na(+)/H(+) antiporter subunit C [Mycolicibacterium sp. CBMA 234]MUL68684.1 Na(+)/H(+) antiporter subunit C [Mycolicibacterium sp. CBMA 311]MUL93925.1 Na(+)/H(+) antiporter subunit C [Mycolicibacterium sp. CBMA 230]